MKKLIEYLKKNGAEEYFDAMKLDMDELFASQSFDEDPYRDHNWEFRRNDSFIIVNAIPNADLQDRIFWEEWYIHDGEVHHHVLTLWRPKDFDEIFDCPESDDIHPALSFGKRWYVVEDPEMKPVLFRR